MTYLNPIAVNFPTDESGEVSAGDGIDVDRSQAFGLWHLLPSPDKSVIRTKDGGGDGKKTSR